MHEAQVTRQGDTPAHAGLLHQDGAYSEVKVETNDQDEFVVTVLPAEGKRMSVVDTR